MTDSAAITLGQGLGGLETVQVSTAEVQGQIYLHGAHLTAWAPSGGDSLIWVSPASAFDQASPIRGGVPICFPWFADGPGADLKPSHGFARLAEWTLLDSVDHEDATVVRLQLTSEDAAGLPGTDHWPHRFVCHYTVNFGADSLEMELAITNTGEESLAVGGALHTYLAVSDVQTITITGLDQASYFDKVIKEPRVQEGDLQLTASTDRIYHSTDPVSLQDSDSGRLFTVSKSGSADTIIWNPWTEGAAKIVDLPDDAWPQFVAIEAGNAEPVSVAPGATHRLSQRIGVTQTP